MKHGSDKYFFKDGKKISKIDGKCFPQSKIGASAKRLSRLRKDCRWDSSKYKKPDYSDHDKGDTTDLMDYPTGNEAPRRIFCRLFNEGTQQDAEGLIDLGLAMETETFGNTTVSGNSNIPAGYTYLGQFLDHDITATPSEMALSAEGSVEPEEFMNQRTPRLDLDSLYGNGPSDPSSKEMYADGARLKTGNTSDTPGGAPGGPISGGGPHDLPRRDDFSAIIGDGRNDENLAVAQTHLAFIKFHNKKVDQIAAAQGLTGNELFKAARKEVTLHYQAIVLTDYLPRIIEQGVLQDVIKNGRKFYTEDKINCMPIEFSVAAFRFGHSMVRPDYEWNRVFNSNPGGIRATFELMFEFSGVSGTRTPNPDDDPPFFGGSPTLPSNWPVDWTRMYDFGSVAGIDSHADLNMARDIDANLALALKLLPEFQRDPALVDKTDEEKTVLFSLAARNLLRGRLVKLPSGQQVAQAMLDAGVNLTPLSTEEIASAPHKTILTENGLHENTPLWYYILREARLRHDGNSLGPVGSRILAETFVGLIENSGVNVFDDRPGLNFSMPELLAELDPSDINPLG